MARPLDKKVVKERIRYNKIVMKDAKAKLTLAMSIATKGEVIDAADTRKALANFIKAANAVRVDNAKLNSIGE